MKVRWEGPAGAVNRDLGAEVGSDVVEPGRVHEVSDELGVRLCLSSVSWVPVRKQDEEKVAAARAALEEQVDEAIAPPVESEPDDEPAAGGEGP